MSEEDFEVLDSGGEIDCPYSRCKGVVRRVPVNGEVVYCEFQLDASLEYKCSKNEDHSWGPLH